METSEWTDKSPAEVDTALADNYYAAQKAQNDRSNAAETIRMYAGERKYSANAPRFATLAEAMDAAREVAEKQSWNRGSIERALADYEAAGETVKRLYAEAKPMEAEYAERQWTRAFLVVNSNGHVHSSMTCSTCYSDRYDEITGRWKPGTTYHWMPEYSGKPEAEIVADAGSRACTVCFPSAPVDRPTKMFTPDERSRAQRKIEAEAKRVEKERKRREKALMPDGEPLVVVTETGTRPRTVNGVTEQVPFQRTERLSTLVAGRKYLTDGYHWGWDHPFYPVSARQTVAEAVAAKEGSTVEDVLAAAAKRAAKRR
jgi:hypothetical protein